MTRLVLASASPRRRELLADIGLIPEVSPAALDESPLPDETGRALCLRLAREKAREVSRRLAATSPTLFLAADTVVCVDETILGKPENLDDNRRMMRLLAGRWHQVHTGVCLRLEPDGHELADVDTTDVHFSPMSETELDWYVESGDGMDKAGGYGIQGRASVFVRELRGSYANVVGLPIELVYRLSRALRQPLI